MAELRQRKQPRQPETTSPATSTDTKQQNLQTNDASPNPPLVFRPWIWLQETLPPLSLFGAGKQPHSQQQAESLSHSVTAFAVVWFLCLRQMATLTHHYNGWPPADDPVTQFNISGMVGLFHSSPMLLPIAVLLWRRRRQFLPTATLSELTTPAQYSDGYAWKTTADALLQYCVGYMLVDGYFLARKAQGLGGLGLDTSDIIFLGHHVAICSVVLQTRLLHVGYINTLSCLLVGEVSNPPMNIWYLTQNAMRSECCSGPRVAALYHASRVVYSIVYLPVRCVVMPAILVNCVYDFYFRGQSNVGKAVCLYWLFIGMIIIVGSYDFILECWSILREEGYVQ